MASINFSGIASGIDGNSIIQATVDAKNIQKIPYQNKLVSNEDETKSYTKLRELLAKIDSKSGVFQTFRGTAVTKTVNSSDENIVTGAVSGNAANGTLSLSVNQLASSGRVTFDSTFSDPAATLIPTLAGPANIEVTIGSGLSQQTFSISIDSTTSLNGVIEKLNLVSSSKFSASAINIGTIQNPQYKLMISGQETGIENGSINVNIDPAITTAGILATNQLSQATDAIIDVAGVGAVSRGSNVINDLFPGLSIEVKQVSVSPVILKISNDIDKTTEKVSEFITAFNELRKYIKEEDQIKRVEGENGPKNTYGTLARSRIDDELLSGFRDIYRTLKIDNSAGGQVSVLADLGIKTNKDSGDLELDEAVFKQSLAADPIGSGKLLSGLGDKLSSAQGLIYNYTKFQGLIDGAEKANEDENSLLNDKIQRMEANIQKQKEYLTRLFSKLEETVGKLQANASSLTSLIAPSNNKK